MSQTERDYRAALDSLRFSDEAKERMMKNLMERQDKRAVKGKGLRPLRTVLVAAVVCAALVGTAFAATAAARQARINFFDSWDEYAEAQRAKSEAGGVDYGLIILPTSDDLMDYDELAPMDMEYWWNGEGGGAQEEGTTVLVGGGEAQEDNAPAFIIGAVAQRAQERQTLLDETPGTAGDGWTARRVFQHEMDGQTYLDTKYRAPALSGFDGLWNGWDVTWLEEHYASVSEYAMFERVERDGELSRLLTAGKFQGQEDAVFNLQYSWARDDLWEEENRLTTNFDHIETYTTSDGVNAVIETAASHTGKTLFWVSVYSGHGSFSMFGTQLELDDLHHILDSLSLSSLLEYDPAV